MKLTCQIIPKPIHYDIEIVLDLFKNSSFIDSLKETANHFVIITDKNVQKLYGNNLEKLLKKEGLNVFLFSIPPGEASKTSKMKEWLEKSMFEKSLGKDTCLIAIGGGVVTDLAGFIAATFCRGIPLMMIPTSLLAMVDASIGGKTAVNVSFGKNMIGSIYQPLKIFIDPNFTQSLPLSEKRNGFVEMIKHSLIYDESLFSFFEDAKEIEEIELNQAIFTSIRIKKEIVEQDEKETGIRRILNFGHTIGHAFEKASNYSLSHGQAVALGILAESYLSQKLGFLEQTCLEKIIALFSKFYLLPKIDNPFSFPKLMEAMVLDKKAKRKRPRFVLLEKIGSPLPFDGEFCTPIEENQIQEAIDWVQKC